MPARVRGVFCGIVFALIILGCGIVQQNTGNTSTVVTSKDKEIPVKAQEVNSETMQEANSMQQPTNVDTPNKDNIVDKNVIKIGDKIAGLTVTKIIQNGQHLPLVEFSGQLELEGNCEWEETGDGDGYIFEIGKDDAEKIPQLKGRNTSTSIVIRSTPLAKQLLPMKPSKVKVVLDNFSIGERQIRNYASLVTVLSASP